MSTLSDVLYPFNIIGNAVDMIRARNKKLSPSALGILPPGSRVSHPNYEAAFTGIKESVAFVKPSFQYEYIPVIRKLLRVNSSLSLATSSIVQLANTGHTIDFDKSVSSEDTIKMREHINKVAAHWGWGLPGLHGLINKLIYQMFIGGATSTEWVINDDLSGVNYLAYINPEQIRIIYDKKTGHYEYFQVLPGLDQSSLKKGWPLNHIQLNPHTYQYYGLMSDEESPIGIPPFLSALDDLQSQLKMLRNIGFVSDQLGIMGFLEILLAKPNPTEGESHAAYKNRLEKLLGQAKTNIKDGVKDGMVAGFIDDHEFTFHSSTKDTAGVADIFDINQRMVSNGLLTSPQFLGGSMGGSETMVTIVFTKMLSQLSDIQAYVSAVLEKGIAMELLLQGFKFQTVAVKFKPSTITDEVKTQQASEIKQRISRILYADGIISLPQYAYRMGYDAPDQKEPRKEIDPDKITATQEAKEKEQKDENKSNQSQRAKKKDQPKGKATKQR